MHNHIVHTDDFRPITLFQDSKFWGKNVGARAHLQQWLLRPCGPTIMCNMSFRTNLMMINPFPILFLQSQVYLTLYAS